MRNIDNGGRGRNKKWKNWGGKKNQQALSSPAHHRLTLFAMGGGAQLAKSRGHITGNRIGLKVDVQTHKTSYFDQNTPFFLGGGHQAPQSGH